MKRILLFLFFFILITPDIGETITLRQYLEEYRQLKLPLLYSECFSSPKGKAILIISVGPKGEIWLVEAQDAWVVNSTHIELRGGGIELVDPLGGFYSRMRIIELAEALLKHSFELLTPNHVDSLLTSAPRIACPTPPTP